MISEMRSSELSKVGSYPTLPDTSNLNVIIITCPHDPFLLPSIPHQSHHSPKPVSFPPSSIPPFLPSSLPPSLLPSIPIIDIIHPNPHLEWDSNGSLSPPTTPAPAYSASVNLSRGSLPPGTLGLVGGVHDDLPLRGTWSFSEYALDR